MATNFGQSGVLTPNSVAFLNQLVSCFPDGWMAANAKDWVAYTNALNQNTLPPNTPTVGSALYSLFGAIASQCGFFLDSELTPSKLELRLATMDGQFLDLFAFDFIGPTLSRNQQGDSTFRKAIQANLLTQRVTRAAIDALLFRTTGFHPRLQEHSRSDNNSFYSLITNLTVAMNGLSLPQATISVVSRNKFPSTGTLFVTSSLGVQTITYTSVGGPSFNGCSGGTGVLSTGGEVRAGGQRAGFYAGSSTVSVPPATYGLGYKNPTVGTAFNFPLNTIDTGLVPSRYGPYAGGTPGAPIVRGEFAAFIDTTWPTGVAFQGNPAYGSGRAVTGHTDFLPAFNGANLSTAGFQGNFYCVPSNQGIGGGGTPAVGCTTAGYIGSSPYSVQGVYNIVVALLNVYRAAGIGVGVRILSPPELTSIS